jgi:hypothetical protein
MSRLRLSNGQVSIKRSGDTASSKSYQFEFPSREISLSDTFMSHFKELKLTSKEKKLFKQEYREAICNLKNIDQSFFIESYKSLIKNLTKQSERDEVLTIKADALGSFICLAAIFSGEIPAHSDWRFELDECPLPLFPKELIKVSGASHLFNISFRCSDKSWIKPFPSLRKSPSYMSFQSPQDYEEWRLKVA